MKMDCLYECTVQYVCVILSIAKCHNFAFSISDQRKVGSLLPIPISRATLCTHLADAW